MPRPTARVLTLLELLQSGGTRTVAELADRLGVEGCTVRRYVDQLIDLDVPVESGGYRLPPGYQFASAHTQRRRGAGRAARPGRRRRAGLTTAEHTASETASAKIPAGTAQGDFDGPQAGNGQPPLGDPVELRLVGSCGASAGGP
ncbi:hypothetical protein Shyhy02_41300 [Streptomyces hygroscopicus subsp. hygroscopicus]|nr:hypothetical protein Shyhy02_41300 [Streptomyces hygroscopicus subsp. hygroscopicus]